MLKHVESNTVCNSFGETTQMSPNNKQANLTLIHHPTHAVEHGENRPEHLQK